jgi:hypothetical protein
MENNVILTTYNNLSDDAKKVAIANMRDRSEYINMVLSATRNFVRCELDNIGLDTDSMVQFSIGLHDILADEKRKGIIDLSIGIDCLDEEISVEVMKAMRNWSGDSISDCELDYVEYVEAAYGVTGVVTCLEPQGLVFSGGCSLDGWFQTKTFDLFSRIHQEAEQFYNACFSDGMVSTYLSGRNPECLSDGRLVG